MLHNIAPDEPFGGGEPGEEFEPADPGTTGQVMQFRVRPATSPDTSAKPDKLKLPEIKRLPRASVVRNVSLNELGSSTVKASEDADGNVVLDPAGEPFGPREAALGTWTQGRRRRAAALDGRGDREPGGGSRRELDHPQLHHGRPPYPHPPGAVPGAAAGGHRPDDVAARHAWRRGRSSSPEPWETGWKDTVVVYPGELTRVKARFDIAGLFVWHCHILEHEDNEMMRPFRVGPAPSTSPLTTQPQ